MEPLSPTQITALAERVTEALDERAKGHRLSDAERELQQVCRDRFGVYSPTSNEQICFARQLAYLSRMAWLNPPRDEHLEEWVASLSMTPRPRSHRRVSIRGLSTQRGGVGPRRLLGRLARA
jgi:hypothetical protein